MSEPGSVLVVDDEENVAVTLQAVLQREGYTVLTANSVPAAQDLVTRHQFDAALVDLRFRDTESGLDVLEALNQHQPACMAIMLTGFASLDSAIGAIKMGAYDYLIKPCDMEELKLTVARAVEHGTIARVLQGHIGDIEASNKDLRALAEDLRNRLEETLSSLRERISSPAEQPPGQQEPRRKP
ncbi:MAG: response regulator [Dehalococcoidia bacterium]